MCYSKGIPSNEQVHNGAYTPNALIKGFGIFFPAQLLTSANLVEECNNQQKIWLPAITVGGGTILNTLISKNQSKKKL